MFGPKLAVKETRVLVLVVDETRSLLPKESADGVNFFRLFRRALRGAAVRSMKTYGSKVGVFGILIDTNSHVSDFAPPSARDHSARSNQASQSMLFPPFVLTQTMNIYHNNGFTLVSQMQFYQGLVLKESDCWQDLVKMGRPLWQSISNTKLGLLKFAASKLACGANIDVEKDAFSEFMMFGVSSLLCRLGIRPNYSSTFASRMVADFMSALSYVSHNHDTYVSGYTSEPILAFGAAYLWYNPNHDALSAHILPEFKKLALQDVVDTGGIGETVARVLLLLAMDACRSEYCSYIGGHGYSGEFCSVTSRLKALHGPNVSTMWKKTKNEVHAQARMKRIWGNLNEKWNEWNVGYSHFVQLESEPTEYCTWALLARRAAGIFPRNQPGTDLFIPIFRRNPPAVSMILIQVKNRERGTATFQCQQQETCNRTKFFTENPFHRIAFNEIICVHMDLKKKRDRSRFYWDSHAVPTKNQRNKIARTEPSNIANPKDVAYPLCLHRLEEWKGEERHNKPIALVTLDVAHQLQSLLSPWCNVKSLIKTALKGRAPKYSSIVSDKFLRKSAKLTLPSTLFKEKNHANQEDQETKS